MTVKSCEIHNFQNIKDAILEFDPLINIISGSSDNGKSASLRALLLPVTNKPNNYSYKPYDMKKGGVSSSKVTFDNCIVKRERGKIGTGKYVINDNEKNPLEAFGTSVPDEVSELINIPDYAIHSQHDGYFLLNDSAGQVAKQINNVCDLSIIHESSSKIDSIVKKAKSDLGYTTETLDEKNKEMDSLSYVDDFEKSTKDLEIIIGECDLLERDILLLENVLTDIQVLEENIKQTKALISLEKNIALSLESINKYLEEENSYKLLEKSLYELKTLEQEQEIYKKFIVYSDEIESLFLLVKNHLVSEDSCDLLEESLSELEELQNTSFPIIKVSEMVVNLIDLIENHTRLSENKNKLENSYNYLQNCLEANEEISEKILVLQKAHDDFEKTFEVCETCGNIWEGKAKK